jgi:hypothetical protein
VREREQGRERGREGERKGGRERGRKEEREGEREEVGREDRCACGLKLLVYAASSY